MFASALTEAAAIVPESVRKQMRTALQWVCATEIISAHQRVQGTRV